MAKIPRKAERSDRRQAGELEARVLAALWAGDQPGTVQDVLEQLDGDVVYTTVATVLDRLHAKGAVTRALVGRAYLYRAVSDESAFVAAQVRALLDRSGDRAAALQGLIEGLEPGDSPRLIELLLEADRRRDPAL